MLDVRVERDAIRIGRHFAVIFQRTLRIPDDGGTYPLPPGLGAFPVLRVEDYADRVPPGWREHSGVFIPMYQREALWLSFTGAYWRPNAVKVAVGKVNAVSGKPWDQALHGKGRGRGRKAEEQDYLVVPVQPWLDGINAGDGSIRQFVAMPLGMGYTVEGQVTGKEEFGGIQLLVFDPKPGRFPDEQPEPVWRRRGSPEALYSMMSPPSPMMAAVAGTAPGGAEMGLAAGGRMEQKIYPDPHGVETWDPENYGRVYVHIVNSMLYREITGQEPPPTPVTARTYTEHGFPWFALYDEAEGDVAKSGILAGVKSVRELDEAKGFGPQQDDTPVAVPEEQIKQLKDNHRRVKDGKW